jgi:hypothetical protein
MDMHRAYGLSSNLFVTLKSNTQSVIVGGIGADTARWTRVLSEYAGKMLWFNLTLFLYHERAASVTALVKTFQSRVESMPIITDRVAVEKVDGEQYEVTGWIGEQSWTARMTATEAQRLWSALDVTLHPTGWSEGK